MSNSRDAEMSKSDSRVKKPRLKKNDSTAGQEKRGQEKSFIGQEVYGTVDGSFDAGFLLTVKVGDSPIVLRGLVFEPGMSLPLSKVNDIAPKVKTTVRDQNVVIPSIPKPSPVGSVAESSPVSEIATQSLAPITPNTIVSESQAPTLKTQTCFKDIGSQKLKGQSASEQLIQQGPAVSPTRGDPELATHHENIGPEQERYTEAASYVSQQEIGHGDSLTKDLQQQNLQRRSIPEPSIVQEQQETVQLKSISIEESDLALDMQQPVSSPRQSVYMQGPLLALEQDSPRKVENIEGDFLALDLQYHNLHPSQAESMQESVLGPEVDMTDNIQENALSLDLQQKEGKDQIACTERPALGADLDTSEIVVNANIHHNIMSKEPADMVAQSDFPELSLWSQHNTDQSDLPQETVTDASHSANDGGRLMES